MYTHAQQPRFLNLVGIILAAFIVAGCASSSETVPNEAPPETEDTVAVTQPVEAPVEEEPEPSDFNAAGDPIDANGRPISRTFYFDYDRAVLRPADLAALELHAQILRRNTDRSVVIEGHCDERGTREYNLALGERRADAVRSFLLSAGVGSRQIETVSYGEERPEDPGHDDSAWARNRRAIVAYR
ncbi:MAG: peptidoglycan-associated lipoprotein Pal [Pseudomonadota bacterium]